MCLYKSKSHLPSQLNQDLKNSHVLTTESLRNEGRGFYLVIITHRQYLPVCGLKRPQ